MELFNVEKVHAIFHVLYNVHCIRTRGRLNVYTIHGTLRYESKHTHVQLGEKVRKETNEKRGESERDRQTLKYKYRISLMIKTVPNFMILCAHVHVFITSKYSVASSCSYARNVLLFKSISILWSCTNCTHLHTHKHSLHI